MKPEVPPAAQRLPDSRGSNLFHADPSYRRLLAPESPVAPADAQALLDAFEL